MDKDVRLSEDKIPLCWGLQKLWRKSAVDIPRNIDERWFYIQKKLPFWSVVIVWQQQSANVATCVSPQLFAHCFTFVVPLSAKEACHCLLFSRVSLFPNMNYFLGANYCAVWAVGCIMARFLHKLFKFCTESDHSKW